MSKTNATHRSRINSANRKAGRASEQLVRREVVITPSLGLFGDGWDEVKDGDPSAYWLFRRYRGGHYSARKYKDGRDPLCIAGPGEKMLLVTPCRLGLFVWRLFISADKRQNDHDERGLNCAVFRNETRGETRVLSSKLILAAEDRARQRWPGRRVYTYVDGDKTTTRRSKKSKPGACFRHAGWTECGRSKSGLVILEKQL